MAPLPRRFYDRPVERVARDLLGKRLLRRAANCFTTGRIVEVEAYLPLGDSASHAFRGQKPRNAAMFGPPGHAYVYAIHSRHCLNVVTEPEGIASAVLIRAVEPLDGLDLMKKRRGTERVLDLARGPGRLCQAFDLDRAMDGWDLVRGQRLWIAVDEGFDLTDQQVVVTPRVGVTSAKDLPLRFFVAACRFVSGPRSVRPATRPPRTSSR